MNALSLVMLLSGAATLVLEIAWIRQLGLTLGRTHGAMVTVTAAFLAGLAGGAWLSARWRDARAALARSQLAAGVLALGFPVIARGLDGALDALAGVLPTTGRIWWPLACGAAGAIVLVPAALLGVPVSTLLLTVVISRPASS